MFTKKQIELAPKVNKVLNKLGWKWKPQWRDLCWWGNNLACVIQVNEPANGWIVISPGHRYLTSTPYASLVPILHWEELLSILTKVGYVFEVAHSLNLAYGCRLWKEGVMLADIDSCNNWQEAVMRAIIKLGEGEINVYEKRDRFGSKDC